MGSLVDRERTTPGRMLVAQSGAESQSLETVFIRFSNTRPHVLELSPRNERPENPVQGLDSGSSLRFSFRQLHRNV
jgi:hypothetical protein